MKFFFENEFEALSGHQIGNYNGREVNQQVSGNLGVFPKRDVIIPSLHIKGIWYTSFPF